ncbi:type II toxin-antitoxin system RelE/ParE family toxin [Caenispirillum bisanense]|uniref:Addiction module toxin, RelE/StbE family n=1 Tax=Caenispirillum bisanense TaxID=414052 RepID=A0A286GHN0_9PROT|nr:type II toxin-antitoxin system RelE/ParE family toxin [Caenispirillum bisanense]SOD94716.1 addiction module toxin, RelE/StbE family [Caenispirillum bisanense]
MRVRWTVHAIRQLAEVRAYIAEDNPAAARWVARRLRQTAALLRAQPFMGRSTSHGQRELLVSQLPYIIAYRIADPDTVEVLGVVHTARDRPAPR